MASVNHAATGIADVDARTNMLLAGVTYCTVALESAITV